MQFKKIKRIWSYVSLIVAIPILYYWFVVRYLPPEYDDYVDLTIVSISEIRSAIKSVVFYHADRDAQYLRVPVRSYSLNIFDRKPVDGLLSKINDYDIPKVNFGNVRPWSLEGKRRVKIDITTITPKDRNTISIEVHFSYGPSKTFSNRFLLEKSSSDWEITSSNSSERDYKNIGLFKYR